MRKPLRRHSDDAIRLEAPIDTGADPSTPITVATVTARIYDLAKDSTLTADEASAQTTLSVSHAGRFEVGDVVRVEQDNSVFLETTVASVSASAGTIELAAGLSNAAAKGSRIARKLGANIICVPYNAAAADLSTTDWGFVGEKEHDHADLRVGMGVRVEITLDDGSGRVGLEWYETTVVGPGVRD